MCLLTIVFFVSSYGRIVIKGGCCVVDDRNYNRACWQHSQNAIFTGNTHSKSNKCCTLGYSSAYPIGTLRDILCLLMINLLWIDSYVWHNLTKPVNFIDTRNIVPISRSKCFCNTLLQLDPINTEIRWRVLSVKLSSHCSCFIHHQRYCTSHLIRDLV